MARSVAGTLRATVKGEVCRSTSATRSHPGSVDRTRSPTACCARTSPRVATSRFTPRHISTPWPGNSTDALDKPWLATTIGDVDPAVALIG
jgi:hypothetical protein